MENDSTLTKIPVYSVDDGFSFPIGEETMYLVFPSSNLMDLR
jgi:hypothetical protein